MSDSCSFAGSQYLPVLQIDMLGSRLEDLVPVNSSVTKIPATFIYTPISFGKLRLWMQFTQALQMLRVMGFTEKDIDELKGIFADTNIVFLCATFVVSAMHVSTFFVLKLQTALTIIYILNYFYTAPVRLFGVQERRQLLEGSQ